MEYAGTDYIRSLVFPILLALPIFLIIFIGIAFSIIRYKTAPKASLLSIIALVIFLLLRLVALIQPLLSVQLVQGGIDSNTFAYVIGTVSVLSSIFGAIALGLLIFAVWTNRSES